LHRRPPIPYAPCGSRTSGGASSDGHTFHTEEETAMSELVGVATDANFKTEVEDSKLPTLVDFWAPWCGPCRAVGPVIEELAREYSGRIKVLKLNTDENPDVPTQHRIQGIPTVILFKDGRVVDQIVGAYPKRHFVDMIEKHL
jgi:thioredoxin